MSSGSIASRLSLRLTCYLASWARYFKQYDRAISWYQHCLDLDPDNAIAKHSLAMLYTEQGRIEQAFVLLKALHQAHPDNNTYCFNLAYLYQQHNSLDEALALFLEVLTKDPKHDRAWYGLGLLYLSQGNLNDAVPALLRNTELQPMSPYGWYQLAIVYQHLGKVDEAKRIHNHLATFEPKFARGLANDLLSMSAAKRTATDNIIPVQNT